MSARYSASNQLAGTPQANTTTHKTQLTLTAATASLRRAFVYDLLLGADGTPADNVIVYDVSRQTAAGTATAVTPVALDPADAAADTVGAANATAEGTITAASSVLDIPVNQRASYRWVAAPGSELVIPATNLAGFAFRTKSPAYTGTTHVRALHAE